MIALNSNYFQYWIDSKKDKDINQFVECIDSYIYFKKDTLFKIDCLIQENPEFNAPKLLKTFLLLFSRDINKLTIAKKTFNSISTDKTNKHFNKYLEVASFWIKNDLENLLKKLESIIKDNPKDIFAIRL